MARYCFGGDEEVVHVSHCLCDPCIPKRMRFGTAGTLRRTGVLREVPRTSLVELRECDLLLHLAKYKSHLKGGFVYLVETRRIELPTFALRTRRSPS